MPRGNKMGPMGQGPMTGRGLGYCAGNSTPGHMVSANDTGGGQRRRRRRRSGGRMRGGWRQAGVQAMATEAAPIIADDVVADAADEPIMAEIESLQTQTDQLEAALQSVRSRLASLNVKLPETESGM